MAGPDGQCIHMVLFVLQVLAEQHFLKLSQLRAAMPADQQPNIAILTGSVKQKEKRQVRSPCTSMCASGVACKDQLRLLLACKRYRTGRVLCRQDCGSMLCVLNMCTMLLSVPEHVQYC